MSIDPGTLYVVATPIGNLGDITARAIEVLEAVDRLAAEDTRHSRPLLQHFGICTPMVALHEHNERQQCPRLVAALQAGESIALISDAGTPLLSDPGYHLVRLARQSGIRVVPVPGPSALVAALSAAGLPTDHFVFEGFLSAKTGARRVRLQELSPETRTLVFYESSHRIEDCLEDMCAVFGPEREAVIAREMTKVYETIHGASLGAMLSWLRDDPNRRKGEFVLVVRGAAPAGVEVDDEADRILRVLLAELPVKQAASLAAKITSAARNPLYKRALELSRRDE